MSSYLLSSLKRFLQPFASLTDIVSDATNSLAVIPLVKGRIAQICQSETEDPAELKQLKSEILARLDHRFQLSESARIASMLNPAVRDLIFTKEEVTSTLKGLCEYVKSIEPNPDVTRHNEDDQQSAGEPASKMLKLIQSLKSAATPGDEHGEEIKRYLSHVPSEEEQEKCLLFWKQYHKYYPRLSQLAQEFLAIPASSMSVECMFSTTELIMNSKRSSIDACMCFTLTII